LQSETFNVGSLQFVTDNSWHVLQQRTTTTHEGSYATAVLTQPDVSIIQRLDVNASISAVRCKLDQRNRLAHVACIVRDYSLRWAFGAALGRHQPAVGKLMIR
jgi:hypothetical protein